MNSLLAYTGGKSLLAKRIINRFTDHDCYCEAFAGAAWVFFRKEPSKVEVLNDKDEDLVNLYRIIQNHYEEFVRQFRHLLVSRKIFDILERQDPFTLTDIQRAVKYFYLLKTSFGGHIINQSFGYSTTHKPNLNILDLEERILQIHWRIARVIIENLEWYDCLKRYDRVHTLFYLDPPYYETKDYRHNFEEEDFRALATLLNNIKGKFILSLGGHPLM
ncbi:MAG: DNA adenine methylase, partial [Pseudomonadota bacterium]